MPVPEHLPSVSFKHPLANTKAETKMQSKISDTSEKPKLDFQLEEDCADNW